VQHRQSTYWYVLQSCALLIWGIHGNQLRLCSFPMVGQLTLIQVTYGESDWTLHTRSMGTGLNLLCHMASMYNNCDAGPSVHSPVTQRRHPQQLLLDSARPDCTCGKTCTQPSCTSTQLLGALQQQYCPASMAGCRAEDDLGDTPQPSAAAVMLPPHCLLPADVAALGDQLQPTRAATPAHHTPHKTHMT
jgi:hypothetical protein